jgi:hypothetical protein
VIGRQSRQWWAKPLLPTILTATYEHGPPFSSPDGDCIFLIAFFAFDFLGLTRRAVGWGGVQGAEENGKLGSTDGIPWGETELSFFRSRIV